MASGFFNVGITGLNAAQAGLLTAGHNIANASTAGYSRQYIVQTTNNPLFTGAGFLGQGTNVQTVKRAYNEFLQREVRIAQTNVSELNAYANEINQIDNLLADPSAGLSPALQGFFKSAEEAAANPASIPARQAMLSSSQALVARFNALDQQMTQMRDGVNTQINNEITSINSLVQQVAGLNDRIIVAQAAASSQPANDLLDQRDQLVSDLNKEIQVSVQVESDGSYSVFFGSGQPLVVGGQTYAMIPRTSREDLTQIEIGLRAPSGEVMDIPESLITGGTLGGLLRFRSESLDVAQNSLGRVAIALSSTMNAQHHLGLDLDGDAAGDLFRPVSPTVLGAPTNAGTAVMAGNVTVSDYRVEYDGTNFNVTRLADDTRFSASSMPMVIDGIRLSVTSGTVQSGDVFLVKPGELPVNRVTKLQSSSDAVLSTTGSNLQTMTDSDYRLTMTGAGTFTLTRLSDETVWTGRGTTAAEAVSDLNTQFSPQGFWIEIASGTAQVGDTFLIRPTRHAARDMAVALSNPRDIALAQGFRTAATVTNSGTGKITAGSVIRTDAPISTPVPLTYEASSNSLMGFPVGSKVIVGTTEYNITSSSQRVPFSSGYNYSFGGAAFSLTGTPANGDVFIVNPPPGTSTSGNNGLGALFGGATSGSPAATGSVTPATATSAFEVVAGANDKFVVSVDGVLPAVTVTLNPGSYTPTTLAAEVQARINAASVPDVTVTLNGTNQLVVTSNTAGSVALSASDPNLGGATIAAGVVTSSSSMPSAPITLTYRQADTAAGLPARLTGFPAGTTVKVTLPGGSTREYEMNAADGFGDAAAFSDYIDYTEGATIEFSGMRFVISGTPVNGDSFTIGPNTSASGDNRNILAIGALQLTNGLADGTATYQSSYSAIVSLIGNKTREVEVTLTAQENLVKQGTEAMQSVSGVNLDEEATNLMRYQQAYQAAAKMLDVSNQLFDLITSLGR